MRFCSKNQISKTGITVRAGGDGLHTGAHRGQGRKSGEVWRCLSLGDGSRREGWLQQWNAQAWDLGNTVSHLHGSSSHLNNQSITSASV